MSGLAEHGGLAVVEAQSDVGCIPCPVLIQDASQINFIARLPGVFGDELSDLGQSQVLPLGAQEIQESEECDLLFCIRLVTAMLLSFGGPMLRKPRPELDAKLPEDAGDIVALGILRLP